MNTGAQRIVVMGVAGSGKTTVGRRVARRLDVSFVDADDLHPVENVAKMAAGVPLDDADREPWLRRIRDELAGSESVVVTCSALKHAYRDVLRTAGDVTFVFLDVGSDVILDRVADRHGHFMKSDMVASQFATLEQPRRDEHDVITVDAEPDLDAVVDAVVTTLVVRALDR